MSEIENFLTNLNNLFSEEMLRNGGTSNCGGGGASDRGGGPSYRGGRASNPNLMSTSSNQLKKSVGRIVININSEILELQKEYRKVKDSTSLSKKGELLEKSVLEKKEALEDALKCFQSKPGFIVQEKMEKTVQMISDNITTAEKVLKGPGDENEVSEENVTEAQKKATESIDEIVAIEEQTEEEIRQVTQSLSSLAPVINVTSGGTSDENRFQSIDDDNDEEQMKRELESIGKYQSERYDKMKKVIIEKMEFHKQNLLTKWEEQKDILDYLALKEIRSEFEADHKKLRFMVSEWERRKFSDRLSDHLTDTIDLKFEEYITEYRRMDEEKRTEAAVQRKRNLEMEEYKREKRRAIPSWPTSLSYNKFKQDLISWDKEHNLSTGSVKFGLLAEMMKNQQRITTYEQIQTRLGKSRNDPDIIGQVVALLDTINEETVYNKLSSAWDSLGALKKEKHQTLNDFFSKFETVQYSLNLADDTFKEMEAVEAGKDLKYYEEREKMFARRIEMNDKLKAVHLIKALGVDGAYKRDILAKVDFNKEPAKVYEDTKTAIRDICGDKDEEVKLEKSETSVLVVKPWQEQNRENEKYSRSRSRDRGNSRDRVSFRAGTSSVSKDRNGRDWSRGRDRSRDRAGRDWSRDRNRNRDRSDSRGRRYSTSFNDRKIRRETTPGPGTSTVVAFSKPYDRIFKTEEFSKSVYDCR